MSATVRCSLAARALIASSVDCLSRTERTTVRSSASERRAVPSLISSGTPEVYHDVYIRYTMDYMEDTQPVIEIPQAAYDAAEAALVDNADTRGTNTHDTHGVVADVLNAALPIALAAAYAALADQLTELATQVQTRGIVGDLTFAAGMIQGVTVIRERVTQLRGDN